MNLGEVLTKSTQFLKDKGFESARLEAEMLLAHGLGLSRVELYLQHDKPLQEPDLKTCRELIKRRTAGEPVAYICGEKHFFGYKFMVNRQVLIPRPETEELVEWALDRCSSWDFPVRFVDLGSGSGCIGLAFAAELKKRGQVHTGLLVEKDSGAAEVTRLNSENFVQLGLLGVDIKMHLGAAEDLENSQVLSALGGPANLVLGNPPYIANGDPQVQSEVHRYEPHQALYSDTNGISHILSWTESALSWTAPNAQLIFEIGSDQGEIVRAQFVNSRDWHFSEIRQDLGDRDRFLVLQRRI